MIFPALLKQKKDADLVILAVFRHFLENFGKKYCVLFSANATPQSKHIFAPKAPFENLQVHLAKIGVLKKSQKGDPLGR